MTIASTYRDLIGLEYQDDVGAWIEVERVDAGSLLRTRRLAFSPGVSATARKWRLVRYGDEAVAAVVRIGRVAAWRESAALSAHRFWRFDLNTEDDRYTLVCTEGNAEVYRRDQRVASVQAPYSSDQIPFVRRAHSLDTLITFHPAVPPWRFARQGAADEWDTRPQAFENVPIYDYTGQRAGGVNDVQQLTFVDYVAGETFNLALEGETTASISYSASMGALAASVSAALQALPNVGAGGVSVTSPSDKVLRVEFIGANRADDIGELAPSTLSSKEGGIRVATLTQGKPGGEAVMSDARGWPACGVFFEGRLWMAGLASRPQAILGSRPGFFFDLNLRGADAGKGIDVDLATDESSELIALFPGRHLMAFSRSAEFFCPMTPITPPPPFPRTGKVGIHPGTPLLELEGGVLTITGGGDTVTYMTYEDASQGYAAQPLSSFSSHLTGGIVSGGFRRHRSTTEPNLALWIRASGEATAMSALLSQDVLGFTPWTTDGRFTEASGELAGEMLVGVARQSDGVWRHRLEVLDDGRLLDASVLLTGEHSEVTGLDHLEGRTVAVYVDGGDAGDAVVTDGRVELASPSQRSVEVGLLFQTHGRLLPMALTEDPRGGASMHARVGEIAMRLGPTAALKAGMTGKRMWPVPLKRRPQALLDQGPGEDAFEDWTRVFPVPGFQQDAQIDFVQERPGPLEIREIVVTVES